MHDFGVLKVSIDGELGGSGLSITVYLAARVESLPCIPPSGLKEPKNTPFRHDHSHRMML